MNLPQALCQKKDQLSERNWALLASWSDNTSFSTWVTAESPTKQYSFVFSNNNTKYVILPWGVTVGEVVVISTFFFSVTSKEGWLVFLWWMRLLSPPPGEKVWRVVHWEEGSVVMAADFLSGLFLSCPWTSTYSTLSNKRTGMNYRILWKNLHQGSVIIFDQWKWFRLID